VAATIRGTRATARSADPGLSERQVSGEAVCKGDLRGQRRDVDLSDRSVIDDRHLGKALAVGMVRFGPHSQLLKRPQAERSFARWSTAYSDCGVRLQIGCCGVGKLSHPRSRSDA